MKMDDMRTPQRDPALVLFAERCPSCGSAAQQLLCTHHAPHNVTSTRQQQSSLRYFHFTPHTMGGGAAASSIFIYVQDQLPLLGTSDNLIFASLCLSHVVPRSCWTQSSCSTILLPRDFPELFLLQSSQSSSYKAELIDKQQLQVMVTLETSNTFFLSEN